jgi:hypothetical protein
VRARGQQPGDVEMQDAEVRLAAGGGLIALVFHAQTA